MLPLLNYLRGNILFQLDKPKGIMCALFRNKGIILEEKFSNKNEYLDLQDIGWIIMNYENKTYLNLKIYLNIVGITNDLLLIHPGYLLREHKRMLMYMLKKK